MKFYTYDKFTLSFKQIKLFKLKHFLIYFIIQIFISFIILILLSFVYDTPKERNLIKNNKELERQYTLVNSRNIQFENILQKIHGEDSINISLQEIEKYIPSIIPLEEKTIRSSNRKFGYHVHPIFQTKKFHSGIDFSAKKGTPVYSTAEGYIEYVGNKNDGYGNCIIINHGYGFKSLYGHLNSFNVVMDQKINRGQKIGTVGNTGIATGHHLHYEVIQYDKKINPEKFFFLELSEKDYKEMIIKNNIVR